jgi:hypothetical protein
MFTRGGVPVPRELKLFEATREAKEMEHRLKNELFNGMKLREEVEKLRQENDMLLGQFEAVRSQVRRMIMMMLTMVMKLLLQMMVMVMVMVMMMLNDPEVTGVTADDRWTWRSWSWRAW